MKKYFRYSILWGMLVPVMLIGAASSLILSSALAPPLISVIKKKNDITVLHSTGMAITICEERFTDLLELRMESNPEMNTASKKEVIEEIKKIGTTFPSIKMMVLDHQGFIQGSSVDVPRQNMGALLETLNNVKVKQQVFPLTVLGKPVLASSQYFPFWRWHVMSFISEDEYFAPIRQAERIVGVGIFGTLLVAVLTMFLLFIWKINKPLKKIILATDEVSKGNFKSIIGIEGKNEIARVATAFNGMVKNLANDQKRIESILAELQDSEEQYRVLTENSLTIIAMVRDEKLLYANKAMSRILGYNPDILIGIRFCDLAHDNVRNNVKKRLLALERKIVPTQHFESLFCTKSGKEVWLEILATTLPFYGADAVLIHGVDITTRIKMQTDKEKIKEKLTRVEKMEVVGTLAGGVAHDLNNILGGVVGYPELILMEMEEKDPLYTPLKTIHKSGVKAAAIVQDMLTLTRRGVLVTEVVNLNTLVGEYLSSAEFATLTSYHENIEVKTDLASDLLNLDGSALHLSKTIMNLVTNAVEAMPEGGVVHLITENRYVDKPFGSYESVAEGEYTSLTVSDTGMGISNEEIDKIFEPFYTKKVMGRSGTGLGMSVVWGTVKDHNGYIDVINNKKKGTTFTLYFPVTRKKPAEELFTFDPDLYKGDGQNVLVVDDVVEQRIVAVSMLEKLEYKAEAVSSGEEALDYLSENSVDLILLDMIMDPGLDGLDTYREIQKMYPGQKAIIASGFSETERVKEAQRIGVGAYIRKPYVLETLAIAIKSVFKKEDLV